MGWSRYVINGGVLVKPDFFLLRTALRTAPRDHQPLAANRRQPPTAANRQPPTATNRQPPTANRQPPPTANYYSILFLWYCVLPMP